MRNVLLLILLVAACGDDGGMSTSDSGVDIDAMIDAPPANAMITISGKATERTSGGSTNLQGAVIKAFRNSDEVTPVAMATTDAMGNYSITLSTGGAALDGYLQATKAGLIDTYLYPPYPLVADYAMASIFMITTGTRDALDTVANGDQLPGKGFVALVVTDGTTPVAGAMVTSTPASSVVRYNRMSGSFTLPSSTATTTFTDGIAYLFNVPPGTATVAATKTGSTFRAHPVKARADVLTTTLITP